MQLFVGPYADSGMNRMDNGCAIMVLVDGSKGFAAASYATDTALLAELRATWPPTDEAAGERDGFRSTDLAALDVVGAVRLTGRLAVALAIDGPSDGSFVVVPLVVDDARWRRAMAGTGLSAFVAGVPLASERALGVDQTHDSVVVGERAIVKWFRRVGPEPSRAAVVVAHLDAVGFAGLPAPLGSLTWRSPAGEELTLAQGDTFLPGARDGWEWCVEAVKNEFDPSLGARLGRLTAELHAALRTPSAVIPAPIEWVGAASLVEWRAVAIDALESAVALTTADAGEELRGYRPAMREGLDALPTDGLVAIQPTHGDFHVGQVLEWSGGLAVIDFDGNPTLGSASNAIRQPAERDIAQMLASLDHLGRVVQARADGDRGSAIDNWIADARRQFLAAVGRFDERLLVAFEIEQECRELIYSARFLPRWTYAPMAALRARYAR
jgi:maltokinase